MGVVDDTNFDEDLAEWNDEPVKDIVKDLKKTVVRTLHLDVSTMSDLPLERQMDTQRQKL